jgi:exonuclease SbcC
MAGVDALEKVVATCESELKSTRSKTAETERERADVQTQIDALNLEEGYLRSLETEHAGETGALEADRRRISDLKTASETGDQVLGTLREGAAKWLAVATEASFSARLAQAADLHLLVSDIEPQSAAGGPTAAGCAELGDLARESRERITAFDALRQRAASYRDWLERLLGAADRADGEDDEQTFESRHAELSEGLERTGSARRTSRILMFVFLLSALAVWGLAGLLGLAPDSPQAQALAGWLAGVEEDWEGLILPWSPVVASVLSLLFVGFLLRNLTLGSKLQGLERSRSQLDEEEAAARREVAELARLDDMPLPAAVAVLAGLRDEAIAGHVPDFRKGPGGALLEPERHAAIQEKFRGITDGLREGISRMKEDAAREIEGLHDSVANHASAIARLEEMIARERERVRRHTELTGISDSLRAKIDELDHRARVRSLAIELTRGAIHYISQRFNTEVRNLSADSLPKFTDGRYEHLQIDENLKVKAFSNEKRDFMDLDEISSGTQRQIMLAVRMSLSQKLVNSVIQGPQALFLDEPFAFFDERRTASALSVLPQVSGDFTQIWVTSQTFPAESRFDLYLECNAEEAKSPSMRRGSAQADDAMSDG